MLDNFKQSGFASDIPAGLRDVRRISIVVGEAQLPNQGDIDGPKTARAAILAPENQARSDKLNTDAAKSARPSGDESKLAGDDSSRTAPPATFGNPEPDTAKSKSAPGLLNPGDLKKAIPFLQPGRTQSSTTTMPLTKPPESAGEDLKSASPAQTVATNSSPEKLPRPEVSADSGALAGNDPAAGYMAISTARPETPAATSVDVTPKPWWPLMVSLLGLFLSLGANVYLGWIHQALRMRYCALAQRHRGEVAAMI
jgi:hypothetical protein